MLGDHPAQFVNFCSLPIPDKSVNKKYYLQQFFSYYNFCMKRWQLSTSDLARLLTMPRNKFQNCDDDGDEDDDDDDDECDEDEY